ncbi:MAG: hypothetical protein HYY76_06260 [Acidobacteria bacterium]|nr:hypothetical protein [Acidobacteriota bacterium]
MVLATANGAGYRYGVSDQAFYIPVVSRALDAGLFPRDGVLIDAEGRLMVMDEILAALVRTTGVSLEVLFLTGYLISLGLVWAGLVLIGTRVSRSPRVVAAIAAAFTMRHRIPRTSANSFEPYFHPRVLAFGLGTLAVAALLRRHPRTAIALVGVCALVHVSTALWFAVLIGAALAVRDRRWRRPIGVGAVAALLVLAGAVAAGPLQGSLAAMDDVWLQAVASKDSLFATAWPVWAWLANLGLLGAVWLAHRVRVRRGTATAEDAALVWGASALVALFLATLPLVAAGVSLAVQFQFPRVFWLVDLVAIVYVLATLVEARPPKAALVAVVVLLGISAGRGAYIMLIEQPERALFDLRIPDSPWQDAMRWMAARPRHVHVLADPGHAWKYGTSVRVAAGRDVLIEEVKDSALAIYSRQVAVRFVDRVDAVGDFAALTADRARDLARRYGLDYLVTEADLPLPAVYRNDRFRIYALH